MIGLNYLSDHRIYHSTCPIMTEYVTNSIKWTVAQSSIGKSSNINKILVRQIESGVLFYWEEIIFFVCIENCNGKQISCIWRNETNVSVNENET